MEMAWLNFLAVQAHNVEKAILDQKWKAAKRYNQFAKEVTYEVGDMVLVKLHLRTNKDQGWYKKLAPRWEEGYVMKVNIGHNNYRVSNENTTHGHQN